MLTEFQTVAKSYLSMHQPSYSNKQRTRDNKVQNARRAVSPRWLQQTSLATCSRKKGRFKWDDTWKCHETTCKNLHQNILFLTEQCFRSMAFQYSIIFQWLQPSPENGLLSSAQLIASWFPQADWTGTWCLFARSGKAVVSLHFIGCGLTLLPTTELGVVFHPTLLLGSWFRRLARVSN